MLKSLTDLWYKIFWKDNDLQIENEIKKITSIAF